MKKLNKRCCMLLVILMMSLVLTAAFPAASQAAGVKLKMYNMWATWCGPCIGELPDLGEISRKYQGVVELIGLQTDAYDDASLQKGNQLLAANGCTYKNIPLTDEHSWMIVLSEDNEFFIPQMHFLDRDNKLVKSMVGFNDYEGWATIIEELLADLKDDPGILRGDVNNDGDVNHEDLQRLVDYFVSETKPASMANADADGSGKVDHDDLEALIALILGQ